MRLAAPQVIEEAANGVLATYSGPGKVWPFDVDRNDRSHSDHPSVVYRDLSGSSRAALRGIAEDERIFQLAARHRSQLGSEGFGDQLIQALKGTGRLRRWERDGADRDFEQKFFVTYYTIALIP